MDKERKIERIKERGFKVVTLANISVLQRGMRFIPAL